MTPHYGREGWGRPGKGKGKGKGSGLGSGSGLGLGSGSGLGSGPVPLPRLAVTLPLLAVFLAGPLAARPPAAPRRHHGEWRPRAAARPHGAAWWGGDGR